MAKLHSILGDTTFHRISFSELHLPPWNWAEWWSNFKEDITFRVDIPSVNCVSSSLNFGRIVVKVLRGGRGKTFTVELHVQINSAYFCNGYNGFVHVKKMVYTIDICIFVNIDDHDFIHFQITKIRRVKFYPAPPEPPDWRLWENLTKLEKKSLNNSQGTVNRQKLRYWETQRDYLEGLTKE